EFSIDRAEQVVDLLLGYDRRGVEESQTVSIQEAVDRIGNGVQAVVPFWLGEVAHSHEVPIAGEQTSARSTLLGGGLAFDRLIRGVAREAAKPGVGDHRAPGRRVMPLRTAERQHLHSKMRHPSPWDNPRSRQATTGADPDQADVALEIAV